MTKKVAIIGASYLQAPLIYCAKRNGYETHVFAWRKGDVGEKLADYFYPISIVDKEMILTKCREINIDGICSIASDLATITVNYVANKMGLSGNSMECTRLSTNKYEMRKALEDYGLPCPAYVLVDENTEIEKIDISYPSIIKPTDRSGSRGVKLINSFEEIKPAIDEAVEQSFEKKALIEEYVEGDEYSVEYVSFHGVHHFLACTYKYTTGAPRFVERGQFEPADLSEECLNKIRAIVEKALDALGITNSASHSEIKIDSTGEITIIEIGARMGGDLIGSHLVKESTGVDMVKAVLEIALGIDPDLTPVSKGNAAGVRFIIDASDIEDFKKVQEECPEILIQSDIDMISNVSVRDSSDRLGYFLMHSPDPKIVLKYMPRI